MTAPERIWTAPTDGKCHVGFDTPSLNYTTEYIRADLAAVPAQAQPDPRDEVIARLVEALENMLHDPECPCNACEPMLAALASAKAVQK